MKNYHIPSLRYWILNDLDRKQERSLKRHVVAQDYFGTLATVLSLSSQAQDTPDMDVIKEVVDELVFLQDNYHISDKK